MALLTLSAGDSVGLSLGSFNIIGSRTGSETVVLNDPGSGNLTVTLDPSFNQGGDTIVLAGSAGDYTIVRSGSSAVLTNGSITVTIPVGVAGANIVFANDAGSADDDARVLRFNTTLNAMVLDDQVVTSTVTQVEGGVTTPITVAVDSPTVTEGDDGTRLITFTLTLSEAPTAATVVNYSTAAGTASANDDFVPVAGTVTFAAGQTTATVTVAVVGDLIDEANETFTLSASLNGTTSTGTATIIDNDEIQATLTAGQDTLVGTSGNDIFVGQNRNLNAGDNINGGGGTDVLTLATDGSTLGNGPLGTGDALFGGFTLNSVEVFSVTNDSGRDNVFDLSGTTGLEVIESVNSSAGVEFRNLARETDTLNISNLTNDVNDVDVTVAYRNSAVTGLNSLTINIDDSEVNRVRVGSSGDDDAGIEEVTLNIAGDSTIEDLDTGMSVLNINGDGSITINDLENQANLTRIDARGASGTVELSFSNAPNTVDYLGSSGSDIVTGNNAGSNFDTGDGADQVTDGSVGGDDSILTGEGDDVVFSRAGSDIIETGNGADDVFVTAVGSTSVAAGAGADLIDFAAGTFNADTGGDTVDGGDDRDELEINQSANDGNFRGVVNVEILTLGTGGTTVTLGTEGTEAGFDTINLSTGNDNVTAAINSRNLTINSRPGTGGGGDDTVTTGDGNDVFNFGGDLTDADRLNGDDGTDTLNLNGPTTLTGGNQAFRNFERVNLGAAGNNDYTLVLGNLNAPTGNGLLTIDGSTLGVDDTANLNTSAVTAYALNITTGAADDDITLGGTNNTVVTGDGNDDVFGNLGAGTSSITTGTGDDLVNVTTNGSLGLSTGADDDTVIVDGTGAKTIDTGEGNDNVTANGNATISLGSGEDTLFVDALALNDNQVADGGDGVADLVQAAGAVTDALFTNFSNFEVFRQTAGGVTSVLGLEAQAAGIRTIVDATDGVANTYNLGDYTEGVTVILNDQPITAGHTGVINNAGGGNDTVITGSGNDTIILDDGFGADNNTISTGAGDDTIVARTNALNQDDLINGGDGNDTIAFNNGNANVNFGGAVLADIDLDEVVSIENFVFTDSGDRIIDVVDADNSVIEFRGNGNPVGTLTNIRVDLSAVTDADDSITVIFQDGFNALTDADFAFEIIGSGAGVDVTVDKQNTLVDNNINFVGGASNDTLRISGFDLGATIRFSGGEGVDRLVQTGGNFTDDGFDNISGVEVLAGDNELNATLGQRAEEAGFTTIIGGSDDDDIVIDAAFDGTLFVDFTSGGFDEFDGSASDAVFNFDLGTASSQSDIISGGSTALDTLAVTGETTTGGGITDIRGVTGVETINFRTGTPGTGQATALIFDTNASEVAGGVQTINIVGDLGAGGVVQDSVIVDHQNKGAQDADLVINVSAVLRATMELGFGDDVVNGGAGVALDVRSGAGDDTVTVGAGGQGDISGGDGNDTLIGNSGNDILAGGTGDDTLTGGGGNDSLFGGNGNDTINAGAGADQIYGGLGADTINLSDDNAVDTIFYGLTSADSFSAIIGNFDTINGFESGVDRISLPANVQFLGNVNNFAAVDSSLTEAADGIQAVYDQVANILYIDLDSDGEIDSEDLQIVINTEGDTGMSQADFVTSALVGGQIALVGNVAAANAGPQADTVAFTNGVFTANELSIGIAANLQP